MAKKEWSYRGKALEELQALPDNEMLELIPANSRRKLKRTRPESIQGTTMKKIYDAADMVRERGKSRAVRTHRRDIVIMPKMIGATVGVYNGKKFNDLILTENMIGHVLGEFVFTRKPVKHGKMGVGATGGSRAKSVK